MIGQLMVIDECLPNLMYLLLIVAMVQVTVTYISIHSVLFGLIVDITLVCNFPLAACSPPRPKIFICVVIFLNRSDCTASELIKFIWQPESHSARKIILLPWWSLIATLMVANGGYES